MISPEEPRYIKPHNLPNRTEDWKRISGLWRILGREKVENQIIFLDGNLDISGELLLNNSTLG